METSSSATSSTSRADEGRKGDYPYGIPVPGKPHLVESPYSPGKYIDVEGFPPGTEVKDPILDKNLSGSVTVCLEGVFEADDGC